MGKFNIKAPLKAKKVVNIEDGRYDFTVRGFQVHTDDAGDNILFVNLKTQDAPGLLVPSLRYNVDTEQGMGWFQDFLATVAGDGVEISPKETVGMMFSGNKITTNDGYHNITSVKACE
jgi:hypothetical protein